MEKCLVFGAGSAYLYRKYYLNYNHIEIIGIFDNDSKKWGTLCDNIKIDDPKNIKNYEFEYIFIMSSFYKEIIQQLVGMGIPKDKIFNMYLIENQNASGRTPVANNYIKFEDGYQRGIEVGGANNPINIVDKRITILQVDYCDHSKKDDGYSKKALVKVDIVDDGEKLTTFKENSLDFIIACHMLEHCKNPIGTLRNFITKIKSGGIIFLAIPDKRFTFDKDRKLTSFDHLLLDDTDPSEIRDKEHYFRENIELLTEDEINGIQKSIENDERIHFHVWDSSSFVEFIYETKKYLNSTFTIEMVGSLDNGFFSNEILCVLKKL